MFRKKKYTSFHVKKKIKKKGFAYKENIRLTQRAAGVQNICKYMTFYDTWHHSFEPRIIHHMWPVKKHSGFPSSRSGNLEPSKWRCRHASHVHVPGDAGMRGDGGGERQCHVGRHQILISPPDPAK